MSLSASNIYKIISEAKKLLYDTPYDLGHDIVHHYKVWENCLVIILEEQLVGQIDLQSLYIASWWHDYERSSKRHTELVEALRKIGAERIQIEKIVNIINNHSFKDDEQPTLESKILFDADKLEYINPARWENINLAFRAKKFSEDKVIKYCEALNNRVNKIYDTLYFKTSIKMFNSNLIKMIAYLKSELVHPMISNAIDIDSLNKLEKSCP